MPPLPPAQASAIQVDERLYVEACSADTWDACNVLGLMAERGEGVPKDPVRAASLYERACTVGGLQIACVNLGRLLSSGLGISRDTARARELYEAACEEGEDLACGLLASAWLESADPAMEAGPISSGRMVGRVVDALRGDALPDVSISLGDPERGATWSDGDGRFVLEALPPGPAEVTFSRLGYGERSTLLNIESGETMELHVPMSAEPIALPPIQVDARSSYLEHSGFYARRRTGFGTHLSRRDLEAMVLHRMSRALYRVPGISVRRQPGRAVAMSMRARCPMAVFLDGARMSEPYDLDQIPIDQIEGIEIYHGAANTPVQFHDACGSILVWTR